MKEKLIKQINEVLHTLSVTKLQAVYIALTQLTKEDKKLWKWKA